MAKSQFLAYKGPLPLPHAADCLTYAVSSIFTNSSTDTETISGSRMPLYGRTDRAQVATWMLVLMLVRAADGRPSVYARLSSRAVEVYRSAQSVRRASWALWPM